jgi:hypothetical protein
MVAHSRIEPRRVNQIRARRERDSKNFLVDALAL